MSGILHGAMLGSLGIVSAFPSVVSIGTTFSTSISTTYTLNLPSSLVSGNLLLMLTGNDNAAVVNSPPSGWTNLLTGNGTNILWAYYKTATGSEGSTVTLGWASGGRQQGSIYQISNWTGTPLVGTSSTGSDDPPNLDTGVSAKYLWLAAYHSTNISDNIVVPSGYTSSGSQINMFHCSGYRTNEASSENPGPFNNVIATSTTNTFAVKGT